MTDAKANQVWHLTRRGFFVGMGLSGTALALGIPLGLPVARRKAMKALRSARMGDGELAPLAWIEIHPDERVRLYVPKAEMGQGIHTGLAQIAAEELEVPWDKLEVVHASTGQAEDKYRGTFGSMSIATLYDPLRRAAATMREMLRAEASKRLAVPPEKLRAGDGAFEVQGEPTRRISYGALVAKDVKWQVPSSPVPLKSAGQFKVIGRSMPRVDGRAKVTGKAIFGQDARVEGMLYGAVVRPPTLEARLTSARPGKAARMPGVVKVVIEPGFAGVVARSRLQAWEARDAIEATWEQGHRWQQRELEQIVSVGGRRGVTIQREGDPEPLLQGGAVLTAEYRTALVAHASLETQAALAQVGASGGRVWTSTQAETMTAKWVEKALGLSAGQIEVIPQFLGGGFGRKVGDNNVPSAAVEAARLSRAVDGAPVQVVWDRTEEMREGYVRPMTHHRLAAKLEGGHLSALRWEEASGDSVLGLMPARELLARVIGFDPGAVFGAWIPYAVPNRETKVWRRRLPVLTGQWRGLGLAPNTFALETFLDEAAYAAGKDPLRFRLEHLSADADSRRMAAVLEAAAKGAGWGSPAQGRAQGIACCSYHGTVVAEVVEVSLPDSTGRIQVDRVVVAIDCGRAINPDQVKSQVEGCVVMGTSGALLEKLTVKDGAVDASNFSDYPILTLERGPGVETIIVEHPGVSPSGCGEPPIGPIAPAIGNAFFALTGKRLREMPMSAERVRGVLGA